MAFWIFEFIHGPERSAALGLLGVAYGIGAILGPVLAGFVDDMLGEKITCGLAGALEVAVVLIVALGMSHTRPRDSCEAKATKMSSSQVSASGFDSRRNVFHSSEGPLNNRFAPWERYQCLQKNGRQLIGPHMGHPLGTKNARFLGTLWFWSKMDQFGFLSQSGMLIRTLRSSLETRIGFLDF